jgi:DNA adenine methylase
MNYLPKSLSSVIVPPIKCQGIKTKLVSFIAESISWNNKGRWIEPFLGSGVVLFNIQPNQALIADTNPHIITFYQEIQRGSINAPIVKAYLEDQAEQLRKGGQDFYNQIRTRFNQKPNSLDFLFLNRSCFNGVMRFNSKGYFNVPFGHKPERFRPAYITKIINQINNVQQIMRDKDWVFQIADWKKTLLQAQNNDFVYLDPPYAGRHTDYYARWTEQDASELTQHIQQLPCGFALSSWLENKYRRNPDIDQHWNQDNFTIKSFAHYYHVGSSETLRNEMQEALILPIRYAALTTFPAPVSDIIQSALF